MKVAIGNSKLGINCYVISRAVGDTCPSSCYFLGNGCYAEQTEKQYKNARTAGLHNAVIESNDVADLLRKAIKDRKSIRFHERGDFGRNDILDKAYIKAIEQACKKVKKECGNLPDMWAYTHFYSNELVKSLGSYIKLYASVHNTKDMSVAKKAGFKHFAFIDTGNVILEKKKRGKLPTVPRFLTYGKKKFLVCPEQRKGRDFVTCTGGKSVACNWCVRSHGKNVAFLEH